MIFNEIHKNEIIVKIEKNEELINRAKNLLNKNLSDFDNKYDFMDELEQLLQDLIKYKNSFYIKKFKELDVYNKVIISPIEIRTVGGEYLDEYVTSIFERKINLCKIQ